MGTRILEGIQTKSQIVATVKNTMTQDTAKSASGQISLVNEPDLDNGVSAGQANRGWQYKATLSSGGSTVIDLYDFAGFDYGAGAGRDIVGQTITLEEIVVIEIRNNNAMTADGQLEIEPDSTNGWSPIGSHTVSNGGALRGQGSLRKVQIAEQAFDVTDASSHRIQLTANGGDVDYEIAVLGRHDDNESSSSSSSSSSNSSSSSSSSVSSSSVSSSSSASSSSQSSSSQSSSSSASA